MVDLIFEQGPNKSRICSNIYFGKSLNFQPEFPAVEVHILDFNGDLYGQKVQVAWYKRIRSEQKFSGLEELIQQIEADKNHTINYYKQLDE